jgi:hypothetical protein
VTRSIRACNRTYPAGKANQNYRIATVRGDEINREAATEQRKQSRPTPRVPPPRRHPKPLDPTRPGADRGGRTPVSARPTAPHTPAAASHEHVSPPSRRRRALRSNGGGLPRPGMIPSSVGGRGRISAPPNRTSSQPTPILASQPQISTLLPCRRLPAAPNTSV